MDIKIIRVEDHGTLNSEKVIIYVDKNCNLSYYIVFDRTYNDDNTISNLHKHCHWFDDINVDKGNLIYLYTKVGKNSSHMLKDGTILHSFYWNLKTPIWNNTGDAAILFKISEWNSTKVHRN